MAIMYNNLTHIDGPPMTQAPSQSGVVSEELVERLLQTLVQRIDRGPPSQTDENASSPPEYRPAD